MSLPAGARLRRALTGYRPVRIPGADTRRCDIGRCSGRRRGGARHAGRELCRSCCRCIAARFPGGDPLDRRAGDLGGTRRRIPRQSGPARFHFLHFRLWVPDHHPIHEADSLKGVGPYGEAKIQAEHLCEVERTRGACVSILRPKSFVGPERLGIFEMLYDFAFQGRNFPVLGSGHNRYQLLDVEDVCEAIRLCLQMPADRVNDTFNLGATVFGTLRDSFQAVLDRAGHGKHVIGIPAAPAIAILKVLERLHLSPIYPWIYETCDRESYVSVERIERKLGFQPRYSNRDALLRNYDWYVRHRDETRGKAGVSHRVPWKRGALKLAEYFF